MSDSRCEDGISFAAQTHDGRVLVKLNRSEGNRLVLRHGPRHHRVLGEAHQQVALGLLDDVDVPVARESADSVDSIARAQVSLGYRDHVGDRLS